MANITPYASNDDIVCSLRKYYPENEQYTINFPFWFNTAKTTKDGILVQIGSRKFLIDYYTGSVIKEVK